MAIIGSTSHYKIEIRFAEQRQARTEISKPRMRMNEAGCVGFDAIIFYKPSEFDQTTPSRSFH